MARKGFALCAACAELTPAGGGFCRLCQTPLIQIAPGKDEGHCPACGTLVKLGNRICYGCGWRLKVPHTMVFVIALSMTALTFLTAVGTLATVSRFRLENARQERLSGDFNPGSETLRAPSSRP